MRTVALNDSETIPNAFFDLTTLATVALPLRATRIA
jgi:hypothetical protein